MLYSHQSLNNRFKEAVLAEARREKFEETTAKQQFVRYTNQLTGQEMTEKKKKAFMLRAAIEHNDGLPEEDLDLTLRRTEDLRIELQLDKLRLRMNALRDVNGSDLKKKKIQLPYVPGGKEESHNQSKVRARLFHSQQTSPKSEKKGVMSIRS